MFHMIWWSNMTIHHHPWDESRGVSKKRWWSCKRLNRSKPHTCLNHQVSELLQIWKILQVGNIGSNLGLFLVESFRGILCGGITWDAKAFGLSKGNISWDFLGSCYHFDSRNRHFQNWEILNPDNVCQLANSVCQSVYCGTFKTFITLPSIGEQLTKDESEKTISYFSESWQWCYNDCGMFVFCWNHKTFATSKNCSNLGNRLQRAIKNQSRLRAKRKWNEKSLSLFTSDNKRNGN